MNVVPMFPQIPDAMPHNIEAEQMVLGSILIDPRNLGAVTQRGGADLFYDPSHADLIAAICKRDHEGMLVSPVAMAEWAGAHEGLSQLGGGKYLVRLASCAISPSLIASYVDILAESKDKRDLLEAIVAAQHALAKGDEPASTVAGRLETALIKTDAKGGPKPVSMMKATTDAMQIAYDMHMGENSAGVKSGINALDDIVSGFYPGDLILLGGRPSMGKTAVSLSIGLNAARAGHGVVICSLEMNPEAMAMRALAEQTARMGRGIAYSDMRREGLTEDHMRQLAKAAETVGNLPIEFLPRQFSDLGALYAGAKSAKRKMGDEMGLLIVDYAQLLKSNKASRYDQITEISMALKNLAGQLNVPVVALSQLSRALESREEKRPMMSDLRESGQLEQDADTILFCYRGEYYLDREKPELDESNGAVVAAWQEAREKADKRLEIIVAKQRQGNIGTAHVRCNPAFNLIWEDERHG